VQRRSGGSGGSSKPAANAHRQATTTNGLSDGGLDPADVHDVAVEAVVSPGITLSYLPMTARYTAITDSAKDHGHLMQPDALDSTTDALFAVLRRCDGEMEVT
jgi:hypothetical protein